jgi:hypothetical protein
MYHVLAVVCGDVMYHVLAVVCDDFTLSVWRPLGGCLSRAGRNDFLFGLDHLAGIIAHLE